MCVYQYTYVHICTYMYIVLVNLLDLNVFQHDLIITILNAVILFVTKVTKVKKKSLSSLHKKWEATPKYRGYEGDTLVKSCWTQLSWGVCRVEFPQLLGVDWLVNHRLLSRKVPKSSQEADKSTMQNATQRHEKARPLDSCTRSQLLSCWNQRHGNA